MGGERAIAGANDEPRLPLAGLAARHQGLTDAIAAFYVEAARVCLDRHHESPVNFEIDSAGQKTSARTEWSRTDERTRGAWANEVDATEAGAYACTLAAIELTHGLIAVHRAETRTGADYYVAPSGTFPEDLEECMRLEVSGVDRGGETIVAQRLREKLAQASAGSSNLPAMAGIVGFRARIVLLARVEAE
jgi:hypothetical protein